MKSLLVILSLLFVSFSSSYAQPDSLVLDGSASFRWVIGLSSSSQSIDDLNPELFNAEYPVFEKNDKYLLGMGFEFDIRNFIFGLNFKHDLTSRDRLIGVKRSHLQSTYYGFNFGYKLQPFSFLRVYSIAGIDFEFSTLTLVNDIYQGEDIDHSVGKITSFNNEGYLFYIGLGIGLHSDLTDEEYSQEKLRAIFGDDIKEFNLHIVQKYIIDLSFEVKYVIGIKDEWIFEKNKFDIPGIYPGKLVFELKVGTGFINRSYRLPGEEE